MRNRLRTTLTVGLLAAALGLGAGSAAGAPTVADQRKPSAGQDTGTARFIVKRDPTVTQARFVRALRALDFRLVANQSAVGLSVVEGPVGAAAALRSLPGVLSAARDYTVRPLSLGYDYRTQPGSMTNVTSWTGAQAMWRAGFTGAGVDVALIDSGVSPVPALAASDKVVVGPDLSFESQSPDARFLDSYGHGTVMGGIIAGRETPKASGPTYAADTGNYYGMAPDARLISIKLADRSGAVDVSQVIAAIDWTVENKTRVGNIRVLNLSYGARSSLNPADDPLSWAAEMAWRAGIVVVASAGNDGQSTVGLASPAFNPWIIAVGATDTKNTATAGDDTVATFSNTGNDKSRAPDVLAPGIGVVGPNVPNGQIAVDHPGARIGNGLIRGSGTSQAAAVVSGAIALVLQKYPTLNPDEVKRYIAATASTLPNAPRTMQGKGTIQLGKVLTQAPPWNFSQADFLVRGNGKGTLDRARGGAYVTINGAQLRGEVDIMGRAWDSSAMAAAAGNAYAWDSSGQFNGAVWTGGTGLVADTSSWAGRTWQGRTWQGRTWQGTNWNGRTWATGRWTTSGWSSASWYGPVGRSSWASANWSSASWG